MKRVLVLCLLAGAPCASHADDIAFRRLCGGDDAVYGAKKVAAEPELALARDSDELRRVWAENVTGAYRDAKGMPAVAWERDFVVAVFFGMRPSAGSVPQIESVELNGRVLEIRMQEDAPSPAPAPSARPASPYTMVACMRSGAPLAEILMLRLVGRGGIVLVERPAWSYRMMDSGADARPARKGAR